jgi:RND superfamily putative drug exporter
MSGPRTSPPPAARPASRFVRLAGWAQRRRRTAVALWVLALAAVTLAAGAVGGAWHNDHSLPGTESQAAADTLAAAGSAQAGDTVDVVFADRDGGVRAGPARQRIDTLLRELRELPHVAAVTAPWQAGAVSDDGTVAYATVALDGVGDEVPAAAVERLVETAQAAAGDGLRVELGGDAARSATEEEGGAAEGVGMLAALVVLVFLFGSLLAASLPLVTAVFAVGTTLGLMTLASHLFDVPDYAAPLMMLVGLGVGIDYALLVFSRFRSELLAGRDRDEAGQVAIDTAGRSVLFAACTVVIALLSLLLLGLGSLQGIALGVALTVLTTMVAALTLLPALLSILGARIERGVAKRARRRRHADGERWRRWSATVQRRPLAALTVAVAALVALALPATGMRLGFADAGNDPAASTTRAAYDLLADGFGPGFNGPLVVVVDRDGGGADGAAVETVRRAVAGTPGVASATVAGAPVAGVGTVLAFPRSAPQDEATSALVTRLRDDVLPPVAERSGARLLVGGPTAAADDYAAAVQRRLPLFVAAVVGLSALLLTVVFRSLLIPLKAALLNLLSIGASLGVVTLVFQHGLFGVEAGPVEAFVPVLVFAIVFGLSMDYEVFLVSRMHEEWERTGDARRAVSEGLAATGSVITAAAAIMVVVFGAFLLSPDRMLQQFGLGLAVAILLDALVIRCLIVPAAMRLLGERAWWLPAWLRRQLLRLSYQARG